MRVIAEPGLRFKLPTPIESVVRLPKRLLSFKPPRAEYLTQDKKNIVVQSLVTWQIAEPDVVLLPGHGLDLSPSFLRKLVRFWGAAGSRPETQFQTIEQLAKL